MTARIRTVSAAALMLATAWLASNAVDLSGLGSHPPSSVSGPLVWLLATFAGGFVARRRFVPVAVLAWAVVWAAILGTLYSIAAPIGQASVANLLGYNSVALAATFAAIVAGAMLGQLAARRWSRRNNSSKPTPLRGAA